MKRGLCIIFLLLLPLVHSATLHGTIYDIDLLPANNAIVKVNSVPEQTFVAKNGEYSFDLAQGDYILTINYEENGNLFTAAEEIKIISDGDFVTDIILFPDFTEEEALLNEELALTELEEGFNYWPWAFGLAFAIFFGYFWKKVRKPKKTELDENLLDQILEFIKKNEGRVTQREIRKNFPYSEAKISLAITELEHKGKVQKIKKSKGNIILLQ